MSKEKEIQRRRRYQREMFLPSGQACPFPPVFLVSLLVPRRAKKAVGTGKQRSPIPTSHSQASSLVHLNPDSVLTHPILFPWEPTRRLGSHAGKATIHRYYSLSMAEFALELLQHREEKETSLLKGGKISVPR